ncbi:phosphotransferase [Serinibacter salmoneus]|uniref:Phosphotransferase family enzyme n=1 Tax=Serinibacter salmoneus TaxID=556530 RepID=A0A2A9D0S6_9MICO|nr:phosphotransferase [Serinibacter salmoneus]PFG20264.1 phosphotransferase family enzyme [Serinibacter salmoneus]
MAEPAMSRRRPTWPQLPESLRAAVQQRIGAVIQWRSHDHGYSPGPALTLTTDHDEVFLKAAFLAGNPHTVALHRREAEIAAVLPAGTPTPSLRWSNEVAGWVVLVFDAHPGSVPPLPWRSEALDAVAHLTARLAEITAPDSLDRLVERARYEGLRRLAGEPHPGLETFDPWLAGNLDALASIEGTWTTHCDGDRLLHHDLRRDNVLLDESNAVAIDWPHAVAGAGFTDLVGWLPSLHLEGGPAPEEMLRRHPLGRAAAPEAVTSFIAAIAGYFVRSSLQPPPPGIPHLRGFQRAQGEVCIAWLRERLGDRVGEN